MSQETIKEALSKTMDAIKSNPPCANAVFRAQTQLIKDVRCSVQALDPSLTFALRT